MPLSERYCIKQLDQLAQFEEDQSLTGIWILDADLNTEYYADRDQMERSNLLEQILSEDNVANAQQYPQKSYAERLCWMIAVMTM